MRSFLAIIVTVACLTAAGKAGAALAINPNEAVTIDFSVAFDSLLNEGGNPPSTVPLTGDVVTGSFTGSLLFGTFEISAASVHFGGDAHFAAFDLGLSQLLDIFFDPMSSDPVDRLVLDALLPGSVHFGIDSACQQGLCALMTGTGAFVDIGSTAPVLSLAEAVPEPGGAALLASGLLALAIGRRRVPRWHAARLSGGGR